MSIPLPDFQNSMATHRFSISAIPLILGAVMLMNFEFLITKASARHLLELQLPKEPKELPKPQIPILPMSELLPLPKVELPSLPHLPPLEKRKLSDDLSKPQIPKLPKVPNLPKPELPKLPELPILPH